MDNRERAKRLVIEIFDHPNAPNLEPSPLYWIESALNEAEERGMRKGLEEAAKRMKALATTADDDELLHAFLEAEREIRIIAAGVGAG
jgi:hypothetical protein